MIFRFPFGINSVYGGGLVYLSGDYRFRADKNGTQYWSGTSNHCTVPGCTAAAITTTVQARIGRGKAFVAPLPWPLNAPALPETTLPAPLRGNAGGELVTRTAR